MTRMTPSEAFVETMVANWRHNHIRHHGVLHSWTQWTSSPLPASASSQSSTSRAQLTWPMATRECRGKHGVVIGQNGPGISNCVTAIAAAFWAHSPVVIVTPETGTMGIGLGGFQEANQLPMFEEFTKYQGHINNENRMAEITARVLRSGAVRNGPDAAQHPTRPVLWRHRCRDF